MHRLALFALLAACGDRTVAFHDDTAACGPGTHFEKGECVEDARDADRDGWLATEDCDDGDSAVNPGAAEACNGVDDDCDGTVDDAASAPSWYEDADGDGFGGASEVQRCDAPAGYVDATGDCDDTNPEVWPGAAEACNGVDDNCDGSVDEGAALTWYLDGDADGVGDATVSASGCSGPGGYVAVSGDCDDAEPLATPGREEVCGDGIDNDCLGDLGDCAFAAENPATTSDFRLSGSASGDQFGAAIALGDFDGDGVGDLASGLPGYDGPPLMGGATAIWYGPLDASGTAGDTADAFLTATMSNELAGSELSAGDFDGDGIDDLLVGANNSNNAAGAAYLLYGGSRVASGSLTDPASVAVFLGAATHELMGWSVSAGQDLDGDGTDEVLVGAPPVGAAYLFYGSTTREVGYVPATSAGATIEEVSAGDMLGWSVTLVEDMDGDGLGELLVGAYNHSDDGAAYLFLGGGGPAGTLSASAADVTYGGAEGKSGAGEGVYDLTDVTGDGYGDAGVYGEGASDRGALAVFGGGATLSTAAAAILIGDESGDALGEETVSPGDLDGDGVNDLLVGVPGDDRFDPADGSVSLWYGPVTGTLDVLAADVVFMGADDGRNFGRNLPDRAGDVTGDGLPDVVIGDDRENPWTTNEGAIYVWDSLGGE